MVDRHVTTTPLRRGSLTIQQIKNICANSIDYPKIIAIKPNMFCFISGKAEIMTFKAKENFSDPWAVIKTKIVNEKMTFQQRKKRRIVCMADY